MVKRKVDMKKYDCAWCGESKGVIKFYILADDLENPKPYHAGCVRNLQREVMLKLSDIHSQINLR